MDDQRSLVAPGGVRDGDVLIYMGGRLLIVDHLVPEAFTIDLTASNEAGDVERATP